MKRHRMQRLHRDEHGAIRFRKNAIVAFLLDKGPFSLNDLAGMRRPEGEDVGVPADGFSTEDWRQFAQLIGYSADGYCSLSYVSRAEQHRVGDAVEEFERSEAAEEQP